MPKPTSQINCSLILAIALIIASKRLQKRTGIDSNDWLRELLELATIKFNQLSVPQIQKFLADHYSEVPLKAEASKTE